DVRSPQAFLTTITTRLCLKHLQSARVKCEHSFGGEIPEFLMPEPAFDPSDHARLADSLSIALLVMLQSLSPIERAVFLLREVFEFEYVDIAAMTDKNEENCRQILRRARERVADRRSRFNITPQHQDQTLQKFLQASATGNWRELMEVLSEDATLVRDGGDVRQPAPPSVIGASAIVFLILQKAAQWFPAGALLQTIHFHGHPVVVAYQNSRPITALFVSVAEQRVRNLCIITCPVRLKTLLVQQAALRAD
ncbi:MAG: RNA polymerase sigma-70 factor, partial [Akkermansiaceae bacterium]|nr:RNA polymerase sigma-70 factor [Verrucomicrobiales bacterium]